MTFINKLRSVVTLKTKFPNWLEYLFIVVVWVVWMLLYEYVDFKSLTIWSTSLLDCLVDGELYNYYEVVHANQYGSPHQYCGYNYLVLIPWAIWNIPIWFCQRFLGLKILEHTWMLFWSRLFLVFVVLMIAYFSKKIICLFTDNKELCSWSIYVMLSCPLTWIGVVVSGQSDIIVILITVIAIYCLLKGKSAWFYALMIYVIAAKPFFIFAYVAIVLLTEKNILKILLKIISSFSLMAVFHLIYANAPLYLESIGSGTANSIILYTVINSVGALRSGTASFVIMGLVIIYFIAYCIKYNPQEKESKYYVIYMSVVPMLIYFSFGIWEYYRMIYLIPFFMILMAINSDLWRLNLLLEKVLVNLMVYILCASSTLIICTDYINTRLVKTNMIDFQYHNVSEKLLAMLGNNFSMINTILISVCVAAMGIFTVINFPLVAKKIDPPQIKCERWLYWLDVLVMGMLTIACGLLFLR